MACILACKRCKFGEKICYNSRDIEFFLGDYFFWRALYLGCSLLFVPFNNVEYSWLAFDCTYTLERLTYHLTQKQKSSALITKFICLRLI